MYICTSPGILGTLNHFKVELGTETSALRIFHEHFFGFCLRLREKGEELTAFLDFLQKKSKKYFIFAKTLFFSTFFRSAEQKGVEGGGGGAVHFLVSQFQFSGLCNSSFLDSVTPVFWTL